MVDLRGWRSIALLLIALAALSGAGCGDDDDDGSPEPKTAQDLKGKRVGVQLGTTGEQYVKDKVGEKPRTFDTGPDALNAVSTGAVDAVVIDFPVARNAEQKQDTIKLSAKLPTGEKYGFAFAKDTPELQSAVDRALNQVKSDGTYRVLYDKYFEEAPPEDAVKPIGDTGPPPQKPPTQEAGKLVVGSDIPYEPFEFGDPPYTGFDVELVNEIGKRLGLEVEFKKTAFDTIFRDVAQNRFDMVASASTITDDRKKTVNFSAPYFNSDQAIVVRK
jgi:polar amino acid transport system substrate-binding protein